MGPGWQQGRRSTDSCERDGKTVTAVAIGDRMRIKGAPVTTNPYRVTAVSDDGTAAELSSGGSSRFCEWVRNLEVVG